MGRGRRTIVQAVIEVMKLRGRPMTVTEVYEAIISDGLYTFNTDTPVHVVRSQIRRHCEGLDFPSSSPTKHFIMQNGAYWLLSAQTKLVEKSPETPASTKKKKDVLANLRTLHEKYLADFRQRILNQIKEFLVSLNS